jgi:hypothetical protein
LKLPLLVGGSLENSGFQLPDVAVMNAITNIALLQSTGVLLGSRMRKAGIDFVFDPSLNIGSRTFELYGKYLSQGYFTEGLTPVYSIDNLNININYPGAIVLPYEAPIQLKKRFD